MKTGTIAAVVFAVVVGGSAQHPPAWTAGVDAVFADVTASSPGCAVAVFRDGRIAYERGYGMADLEHNLPITPASVFYVGSLSKQFTAFAAALAASEGKLSLDDEVRKWIPELPDYGSRMTVRHLIHHTSGLRDYNTLVDIAGGRNDEAFDNATVLRIVARQRALNFKPGDDTLYSNSGYVLLSLVVERAVGVTLAEYAKTRIFQPLGMRDTQFYDDVTRLVKNRAFAFDNTQSGEWRDATPHSQRTGAGGVMTTVRDLLAWDNNFYEPKVGTSAVLAQVHQTGTLNSGKALPYAYGLQIGQYRGLRFVGHGGALGGYRAHFERYPDERVSVASLCNFATSDATTRTERVVAHVLRDRFKQPAPAATSVPPAAETANAPLVKLTATQLAEYAGHYASDEADTAFVFDADSGGLRLKRERDTAPAPLRALAPDRFGLRSMVIRFLRDNGRVTGLAVDAGRVVDIRFTKGSTAAPTQSGWASLWNGKNLDEWTTWMRQPAPSSEVQGLKRDADGRYTEPIGSDRDPLKVFTVAGDVDGRPAIRISGEVFGELRSRASLKDYHLKMQFKWGEKKWPPRERAETRRDSGLLYHVHAPPGAGGRTWARSIELQIQEHDTGDLYAVGSAIAVRAKPRAGTTPVLYDYDPAGEWTFFSQSQGAPGRAIKQPDNEKPTGEWNTVELIALGDEAIHIVNGKVVMRLRNPTRIDTELPVPVTSGPIILQSEGAEIFYRNIEFRPITAVPAEFAAKP